MPVWRLIIGYLAACAAAAVTVSLLTAIVIAAPQPADQILVAMATILLGVPMAFAITLVAALPGAVAIIMVARISGFGGWAYYATGGTLNALLVVVGITVTRSDLTVSDMSAYIFFISLVPAALMGFAAGLTYWRVAVRERRAKDKVLPPKPRGWGTA